LLHNIINPYFCSPNKTVFMSKQSTQQKSNLSFSEFKKEVLNDYKTALISRECSLIGRREVLTGKAKFGIFGDGKELPQIAMAKVFRNGDFRSGYYRDQTFMMAIGALTPKQLFANLYGDTNIENAPESAGRQMNNHFATHSLNEDGSWRNLMAQKNSSSDISCTAGQMPRLLGLAQASKIYRHVDGLEDFTNFSNKGNEVAWGTIGNASTSEGLFWETINAAGVLQVPMVISVWDDEYGISVHARHQTTKESISEVLKGFKRDKKKNGFEILVVKGWDYPSLITTYQKAEKIAREKHIPVLVHVTELTQPQGHSTSGSHERYKSKERLQWEKDNDCNLKFREWILNYSIEVSGETIKFVENESELVAIESEAKKETQAKKRDAWNAFKNPIKETKQEILTILKNVAKKSKNEVFITKLVNDFEADLDPAFKPNLVCARKVLRYLTGEIFPEKTTLINWINEYTKIYKNKYGSHLYSQSKQSVLNINEVLPTYDIDAKNVDARTILRDNFNEIFTNHPETLIFGEDTGYIGDVNQGLEGMQDKFGELRVADTGIREATIIGQGIGMAMRGLRPIAEIQYLDYLLYALQTISDDLATLHYRSAGRQKAPLIIRTRGHRLEGIWHSGSPMSGINSFLKGVCILVPRNMTKAAGFFNTMLESDDPALIIENLNGYRLKEKQPNNFGEFKTPVGVVETLTEGTDITLVSYGSTLKIVEDAAQQLLQFDICCEVIDAQSLMPFDIKYDIVKSVQKTNRLMVIDEDVPGGASAYILNEILTTQNAYQYLDSKPIALCSEEQRPAYGSDGDYFCNRSAEDIFEAIYQIMHEANPNKFKALY
jgi:pyruvate/2-oxoglutarate/acetoin dehydrogenase E1 component/TPP-dependent pyruvate/acetoin dehydrogenase alpha subunit